MADLVAEVAAIHLLALCQAADLRGVDRLSGATRAAYQEVRAVSPFVDGDRPLDLDIEAVAHLIHSGTIRKAVEAVAAVKPVEAA